MNKFKKNTGVFLCLCVSISISNAAYSKSKHTMWLDAQINKDPEVIEARELLNASSQQAKSLTQAIYNPEFEASYEKEGDFSNYSISLSQTIDIWDKQSLNQDIGEVAFYTNQQKLLNVLESKKANTLIALINWQTAKETALLLTERENQLQTLVTIAEQKQKAGLLEPLDAELIYLSLSQVFNEIAEYQIALKSTEIKVQELLPDWTPELTNSSLLFLGQTTYSFRKEWVEQHPKVKVAKSLWQEQQAKAKLSTIDAKTNPTIGFNAGESNNENTIGLTVSIPLNIRNNYSDSIKAAYSEATAAEANFQSIYRKQVFKAKSNFESFKISKKYYEQWQKLIEGRLAKSAELLDKRWEAGDINTADYLVALNQRAEGLLAGIRLENKFKLAEISFISSMGQLSKFEI